MMKDFFVKLNAIGLSFCLFVGAVTSVQLYKVYASEPVEESDLDLDELDDYITEEMLEENKLLNEDTDFNEDPITEDSFNENTSTDVIDDANIIDPFDYDLTCYTPNIKYGNIFQGDYCEETPFSIVNVGKNEFPLTWDEYDPNMAFDIEVTSGSSLNVAPGGQISFVVYPYTDLQPGTYTANYVFYSANDIRQHHRVQVNVQMTIKKAEPYVSAVEVSPANVTIPIGKSYQFKADVTGGNGYNQGVYWTLAGNNSSKTNINADGVLTISTDETSTTIAVIATSKQDSKIYDTSIANVQSVDHMVSITADPSNGGAIAGGGAVRNGGSMRISASPNNNFQFAGWYEGNNLISNASQFDLTNITSDRKLVAKFNRTTCYIRTSVNNTDAGTISSGGNVGYGGKITISANAKSGYYFKEFVEDNKTLSTSSTIELNNITTDRNITAVFGRSTCNVYVSVSPQDTGTYEGAGTYEKGKKVTLKQRAYDGYEFAGWVVNGQVVSTNSEYIINSIENDLNVTATFRKKNVKTYKITSGITNEGGGIVPSGDYIVQEGGSVTYNIVPSANYVIKSVTVDGKNIGAVNSYTFNKVGNTHTISATFEKVKTVVPATTPSNTQQSAVTKTPSTKKADYNETNANKGAIPKQNVVSESTSKEVEELDEEEYSEDTYTAADKNENVISNTNIGPNSIMARHGLDEITTRRLINDNAEMALLKEAYESGIIRVTVNNTYADIEQETQQGLYFENPTIQNFETVVSATLTAEEKLSAFAGTPILFNVSITDNTASVDSTTKALMQKKVGYKPLCYFDFFLMKSSGGNTEIISKTGAELVVTLKIPEEHLKNGRVYTILRNHNGDVDILSDLDDDPTTITFKTDKFSEYSIAYEAIDINKLILRMIVVISLALVMAAICYTNLWLYRHRARKSKRS